ncbi:MAG: Ig-like domain-containing protein [Acetobacterium sp.]|uniref:Ig-like domain-containing protein n=1 Tax=Acetobacterium sp. TaxID=1872094 RepID=UPI003241D86E
MKKITVSILTTLLMLSMVFSSSVFAAEKEVSAWESFLGLFSAKTAATTDVGVEYRGHIQNVGNYPLDGTWIQGPTELGTEGQSLRLEGFWIQLNGDVPAGAHIEYQVHVQNVGWMDPVQDGAFAGTEGKSQQIEAIKISLVDDEGVQLEDYSVVYTGHVQNVGDVGPFKNGEQLGTDGQFLRLEAITVEIVKNAADLTAYEAALAAVTQADYTAASWTAYQAVVNANVVDEDNLQSEVDAATANIVAAQANLVLVPKVTSVTAINLTTLKIDFNTTVDPITSVVQANYKLDGTALNATTAPKVVLSTDAKSVTITLATALTNKTNYVITTSVADAIKSTGNVAIKEAATLVYVNDTTKPIATLVGYNKAANTFTVNFDETLQNAASALTGATVSLTKADGTFVTPTYATTLGTNFVLDTSGLVADTTYTVTIEGAKDLAGNYFEGNKLSYTFVTSATETTKPTVVSAEAAGANYIKVTFSEKLGVVGTLNTNALSVITEFPATPVNYTATVDTTGLVYTIKVPTMTTNTITAYAFSGQKDLSGNTIDNVTKSVSYITGTTPAAVSSVTALGQIVTVTFDKAVTVDSSGATDYTVISPSNVQSTVADSTVTNVNTTVYPTKVQIDLSSLTYENGTYKITLPSGLIKDADNNTKIYEISASLTGADTVAPTVVSATVSGNTIAVVYSELMGTSAIEPSNYTVDGANVFATAYYNGTKDKVILTVKDNAFATTALREFGIQNVKDVAGNVIAEAYKADKTFNDNTQPTIVSATLSSADYQTITVVYNKALDTQTITGYYKVLVGGTEVTATTQTLNAATGTVTLVIDTALTATQFNQAITIAPSSTFNLLFGSGQKVTNFTTFTVAK